VKDVKCPNCDGVLSPELLDSGWCEGCGHKVPRFIYEQAGAKAPGEGALRSLVRNQQQVELAEEKEDLPIWKILALGAVVLTIAAVIVLQFV
jgi:hypothetical protein